MSKDNIDDNNELKQDSHSQETGSLDQSGTFNNMQQPSDHVTVKDKFTHKEKLCGSKDNIDDIILMITMN